MARISDIKAMTFTYNKDGLRVKKVFDGTTTNYTLHGKNIVHMSQGSNKLHFYYDAQNRVSEIIFNSVRYGVIHNLQGDVIGFFDNTGTEVVRYVYDSWGKLLSTTGSLASTLGTIQPFRYRGYVYDVETGLYYLRSRYYNPEFTRFLSTDAIITVIGDPTAKSVYCYSKNAPTIRIDLDGSDSYYVMYDCRNNGSEKGLKLQGEWAINYIASRGDEVKDAGFKNIPEFIRRWNSAGNNNYDYIVIYAHGSPGTIDCNHGYLKETLEVGLDENNNYCYSSINELSEIRVNKGIILFSCNGATPDGDHMTAIGMLSSKAGGIATQGSAYASVNYIDGTGIPCQGPGISNDKSLFRNIKDTLYWLFSSIWVTFSYDGISFSNNPNFPN